MIDLGKTKAVWLLVLKEGGRWSTAEIENALPAIRGVRFIASRLGDRGYLKRFEKTGRSSRITYGITPDCKVPIGVELSELMALGLVKVEL